MAAREAVEETGYIRLVVLKGKNWRKATNQRDKNARYKSIPGWVVTLKITKYESGYERREGEGTKVLCRRYVRSGWVGSKQR